MTDVVSIDDLFVFSKDKEIHYRHLEIDLSRLNENELYVSNQKRDFLRDETSFPGLLVGKDGIKVSHRRSMY